MPARRPRISRQQTEERMLSAAVDQVNAAGLTVSLDHLSFEAVISAADVSRTAAYRKWPNKELFLNDLVRELARAATPRAVVQNASWGLISELVLADAERLADPGERWRLGVELMRQAADADFAVMYASAEWRTYLALNATFLSIADPALRAEVQVALAAAQRRFVEGIAAGWEILARLLGFRLRAGVTSFDTLAAMISASVRGLVLMALADPGLASDRLEADPFEAGTAPWSLAALGCASIAAGFLEPDPDVVWDAARAASLRSAMAAESLPAAGS